MGRPVGVAIDARGAVLVAGGVGNSVWRVNGSSGNRQTLPEWVEAARNRGALLWGHRDLHVAVRPAALVSGRGVETTKIIGADTDDILARLLEGRRCGRSAL